MSSRGPRPAAVALDGQSRYEGHDALVTAPAVAAPLRLLGKNDDAVVALKQSFYPNGATPLEFAINLVRLGRIDEAKAQVKLMLEKNDPTFTQAKWRQASFYSEPSIIDGEVVDLAKAGLPEK